MKRIINGKLYNTETAQLIGSWANTGNTGALNYLGEDLYRKKNGEFFLFGEGGPMTQYAKSLGDDGWSGGEKIIPLSWESARKWAEKNMDVDEYEKIFGEIPEDDSTEILSVSLPACIAEKARRAASMEGKSLSQWIAETIDGKTK